MGSPVNAIAISLKRAVNRDLGETVRLILLKIESHAALTQAIAAVASTLIAAGALIYAVRSLKALQRQAEASIAFTTETFRPIIEVLGGSLMEGPSLSEINFVNKGNGAALNFRWRVDEEPERWGGYKSNIIAPQENGILKAQMEWRRGLVLSYNSVAHREEILTYVKFGSTGHVSNSHDVRQGAAVTRMGWTVLDPKLAIPGWDANLIGMMPWRGRLRHWWRLKQGKERRL
jgi:hypothetical protein